MQDAKLYKWLIRLDKAEQNAFVRYVEALGGKNREELGRMAKLFVKAAAVVPKSWLSDSNR